MRSRALVFDEMASRHAGLVGGAHPDMEQTIAELRVARRRLSNLVVRGRGKLPEEQYRDLIAEAERNREAAEQKLAGESARFRVERSREQAGSADVQAALPEGATLIAFRRYRHGLGADAYCAFRLSPGSADPIVVPLGPAAPIDSLVADWRRRVHAGAVPPGPLADQARDTYVSVATELRRAVWGPVAGELRSGQSVFIVPDAALHLVNLAALPDGQGGYLLTSGPLMHLLSTERDLVVPEVETLESMSLLAVGAPDYDAGADGMVASAGPSGSSAFRGVRSSCGSFEELHFTRLVGTKREVEALGRLSESTNGAIRTELLVGADATEPTLKFACDGYDILHIATHGFFLSGACGMESASRASEPWEITQNESPLAASTANPLVRSGLALAGANHRASAPFDQDDGVLTAEEIGSLDLTSADWVVLSACDTGLGKVEVGEGVLGLRRAFRMAGARTLVLSLWKVDDAATRVWMEALYEARFRDGLSSAEAVRAASVAVLNLEPASGPLHPYFWAPFVATGDWR